MDIPIWFSIGSAILMGFLVVMIGRFVLDLWRRQKSGEIQPGDDWDPFA